MTAPAPESERKADVAAVVLAYAELPETPLSANLQDHRQARRPHDRGISLRTVESTLLLGSMRRLIRSADLPPLRAIRSLPYFQPVIDEHFAHPCSRTDSLRCRSRCRTLVSLSQRPRRICRKRHRLGNKVWNSNVLPPPGSIHWKFVAGATGFAGDSSSRRPRRKTAAAGVAHGH